MNCSLLFMDISSINSNNIIITESIALQSAVLFNSVKANVGVRYDNLPPKCINIHYKVSHLV